MSATNGSEASASNDSVLQFFTAREQQLIMHALVCMKDFPAVSFWSSNLPAREFVASSPGEGAANG